MYAGRLIPTPTMSNAPRPAVSARAIYTSSALSRGSPGDHYPQDNSIAAYHVTSPSWQSLQPQPQNSADGISYASHGANIAPQSSPFRNDHSELVTGCASNRDPRPSSPSHAYTTPRGDQHYPSNSVDIKQEIKEEEGEMNWLAGTGEQSYAQAPRASMHISKDPCDVARPSEAGHSPFVKVEPSYPPDHASGVSDSGVYSSAQAMLHTYGSPNAAPYIFPQEFGPDSQAETWMPAAYIAEDGSYIPVQPWAYMPVPSYDEAFPDRESRSQLAPIQNHRSYTLENAITPVTPTERTPRPLDLPVVPSPRNRPIMDHLSPTSEDAATPSLQTSPPSSPAASPSPESVWQARGAMASPLTASNTLQIVATSPGQLSVPIARCTCANTFFRRTAPAPMDGLAL
ncbi:hypothetical protein C8Q72DRAFT_635631 [Fomitopsis betulina]|nr:hypothetical protein C8Q72DRAFT_635631 [Fomitopsis betulina]